MADSANGASALRLVSSPFMRDWHVEKLLTDIEHAYNRSGIARFWHGEQDSLRSALEHFKERLSWRYSPRAILGVGGSGVVLRLADNRFPQVDTALKFPRPVTGKVNFVADLLNKEVGHLAKLRHPGIVRILDHDQISDVEGYGTLPFYLMEAIDGLDSTRYLRNRDVSASEFVSLVLHAAEVIRYLHDLPDGSFAHLDIKPDNFVIDNAGRPVMIDLGTCKRLGVDDGQTTVACTRSFAHPGLIRQLAEDPSDENRARGDVKRREIDPAWDIWSFALTLIHWMGFDHMSGEQEHGNVLKALSPYTRRYLLLLAARCLTVHGPAWLPTTVGLSQSFLQTIPINLASQVCDLLHRIDRGGGPLSQVKELANRGGTVQAAPRAHVAITEPLAEVLRHRLFRRLGSISQLGLVCQVYPGARHTRREHSLGTYANTTVIVRALYNDPVCPIFKQLIDGQDIRDLLLASLLHDIGHFPLAHDLEEIDGELFSHSDLGQAMLRGAWDKKKQGHRKLVFPSFKTVFESWQTTEERVLAILAAKPANPSALPKQKLLRSLLSGPIDADKLDYLFRDARNLDLPYPRGVDVDRLLRCLTIVVIERIEGGYRDIPAIGVHAKGKVAAEFLSMARYAMFSQAYWHHAVRVQKAMLARAVHALLARQPGRVKLRELQTEFVQFVCELPESLFGVPAPEPQPLFPDAETAVHERQYLRANGSDLAATDAAVLSWFRGKLADEPESFLIDSILTRSFFKRLWVVSREMEKERWDKIIRLWSRLERDQKHELAWEFEKAVAKRISTETVASVTTASSADAVDRVDRLTKGRVPWLLVDIPGERPGSEVGLHYVLESQRRRLRKDNRVVGHLEKSAVWEQYASNLLNAAGKIRIFCDPALADSIEASIPWEKGIEDLTSVLESMAS